MQDQEDPVEEVQQVAHIEHLQTNVIQQVADKEHLYAGKVHGSPTIAKALISWDDFNLV